LRICTTRKYWDLGFVHQAPLKDALSTHRELDRAMHWIFSRASAAARFTRPRWWTSMRGHEGLHTALRAGTDALSLPRQRNRWYIPLDTPAVDRDAHRGARRRADVEYFRGISNPIAVKVRIRHGRGPGCRAW